MIKFKRLLFISIILIVSTSLYTHYKFPQNNDEWHAAILAKEIADTGHMTNVSIFESGNILKGWGYEFIEKYPRGLHIFINALSSTTNLTIFEVMIIVSIFFRIMLSILSFCLASVIYKKSEIAYLSAIIAALIPSWGTGLGPMFVVASSISYIFIIILLILSTRKIDNKILLLSFILSLSVGVTHGVSTMILLFLNAIFLSYGSLRKFGVFSLKGIIIGIIINMMFFNSWDPKGFIEIDGKLILVAIFAIMIISLTHQYFVNKLSKLNMGLIVQKVLPIYFFLISGMTVYLLYSVWKSPQNLNYFFFNTKMGYFLFGALTIGYLGYISIFYALFDKNVSKFVLFTFILYMGSFVYFMENAPSKSTTVYPRLFIYSAILSVPFISKFYFDIFKGKNQFSRVIVSILLLAALPYGIYNTFEVVHHNYYGDVEDVTKITVDLSPQKSNLTETKGIILTAPAKYIQGALYYGQWGQFYVFPFYNEYSYWLNVHMKRLIPDIIIVPNNVMIEKENIIPHKYNDVQAHYSKIYEGRDASIYVKIMDIIIS